MEVGNSPPAEEVFLLHEKAVSRFMRKERREETHTKHILHLSTCLHAYMLTSPHPAYTSVSAYTPLFLLSRFFYGSSALYRIYA